MAEERLDRLAAMFTEVDRPTLAAVLEAHNGDLQAAASFLLDGAFVERAVAASTVSSFRRHVFLLSGCAPTDALTARLRLGQRHRRRRRLPKHQRTSHSILRRLRRLQSRILARSQRCRSTASRPHSPRVGSRSRAVARRVRARVRLFGWNAARVPVHLRAVLTRWSVCHAGMPKKSLGDKLRKWDVRFFVLTFDAIYYFKFEEDFLAGRPAKVCTPQTHPHCALPLHRCSTSHAAFGVPV